MFGRNLALSVTTVKKNKKIATDGTETPIPGEPKDFEQLAQLAQDTIVNTAVGIGAVIMAVTVTKTVCRMAETTLNAILK